MVTNGQSFQAGSGDFGEIGSQRIISVVSNQISGKEESDSFAVDIEAFSHFVEKDLSPNSRIAWQRNMSRKGLLRGAVEKRMCASPSSNERDGSLVSVSTSSPKGLSAVESNSNMVDVALGSAVDLSTNSPSHHQITITTGSVVGTNSAAESKWNNNNNNRRSYSFRRPPTTWAADPRKILFFFATLSSMGTMLLIFLTLSMRRTAAWIE